MRPQASARLEAQEEMPPEPTRLGLPSGFPLRLLQAAGGARSELGEKERGGRGLPLAPAWGPRVVTAGLRAPAWGPAWSRPACVRGAAPLSLRPRRQSRARVTSRVTANFFLTWSTDSFSFRKYGKMYTCQIYHLNHF